MEVCHESFDAETMSLHEVCIVLGHTSAEGYFHPPFAWHKTAQKKKSVIRLVCVCVQTHDCNAAWHADVCFLFPCSLTSAFLVPDVGLVIFHNGAQLCLTVMKSISS